MHGIIILSAVPVRREPTDKSEMVTQLLFGDAIEIAEQKESWVKIISAWDHYEGWMDVKQFFTVSKATFDNLKNNISPVATDLFQIVTDERSGASFPVTMGSSLPFFHSGKCHIENRIFSFDGNARPFEVESSAKEIVETATQLVHAPYLWGGRTPFGLDCSGFTQIVFKCNGIQMKRDAYQQAELGESRSFVEEAEPGDLAFFDNEEGKIVHVGIVLGDNKIIHASGRVRVDHFDHYGIFTPERGGYTHNLRVIKKVV